ncbi:hypothetical protein C8F04DRAFT_1248553 [Mycena alexandri]|uniref:Uncharacterized protein n=1 Tax=Mycena alexandri TaxID=1745969 RepID=A0AAD6XIH6_9AGAR|nr:hypothetical protein C8F04DRAFT_1248553 [Mycena alexandri]
MRVSTFFAALFTVVVAAQANGAVVASRAEIHDLASFRAASHADQKAFLLQLNPTDLYLSDADLETIAKEPKVAAKLNGKQLTIDEVRAWLLPAQKAFLRRDPATWTISAADLAAIAKERKVERLLKAGRSRFRTCGDVRRALNYKP